MIKRTILLFALMLSGAFASWGQDECSLYSMILDSVYNRESIHFISMRDSGLIDPTSLQNNIVDTVKVRIVFKDKILIIDTLKMLHDYDLKYWSGSLIGDSMLYAPTKMSALTSLNICPLVLPFCNKFITIKEAQNLDFDTYDTCGSEPLKRKVKSFQLSMILYTDNKDSAWTFVEVRRGKYRHEIAYYGIKVVRNKSGQNSSWVIDKMTIEEG